MRQGTCVIVNPVAGSYEGDAAIRRYARARPDTVVRATERAGHARELAHAALDGGFARIVAAGGDGTVNDVVNALAPDPRGVALGVLPLGTGNDLARTLCVPLDLEAALDVLDAGNTRRIDAFRMVPDDKPARYGINASAGGDVVALSGDLDQGVKRLWGVLAYVETGLRALSRLAPHRLEVTCDGHTREFQAIAAVVANGRTCGGGHLTAPHADPSDGLLDVVVVRHGRAIDVAGAVARLLAGEVTDSPLVAHQRAARIRVVSDPPMCFNIDGEPVSSAPISWEVLPGRLDVIVGGGFPGG